MRGAIEQFPTPYPLHTMLPAVLQEDGFALRFTAGLDDVLAPVISAIDCLAAYIDPKLAPADFLSWLSRWPGEPVNERWPVDTVRLAVAGAIDRQRRRGTAAGLRELIELLTGGDVTVVDNAQVTWSLKPGGEPRTEGQGHGVAEVFVEVRVDDPGEIDVAELDAVVAANKPAHVVHRLEVRQR